MARFDAAPMGADDESSGVVGAVARGSKADTGPGHELMDFSVRKGDNGGIVVSEMYKPKLPAGRRASSFPGLGKMKENPFSAKDGPAAMAHITGLLGQMGVKAAAPPPADDEENEPDDSGAPTPSAPAMPPAAPPGLGPAGGGNGGDDQLP